MLKCGRDARRGNAVRIVFRDGIALSGERKQGCSAPLAPPGEGERPENEKEGEGA